MKTQSYLFGILVVIFALVAIGGALYLAFTKKPQVIAPPVAEIVVESTPTPPVTEVSPSIQLPTLTAPVQNTKVKSPLSVSGDAIGYWYFEASFPVVLKDSNGNVLAQAPAQAQGDWMTTSTVPFLTTLTWATTTATSGVLILKNDNPSGLPENDSEISFPVLF